MCLYPLQECPKQDGTMTWLEESNLLPGRRHLYDRILKDGFLIGPSFIQSPIYVIVTIQRSLEVLVVTYRSQEVYQQRRIHLNHCTKPPTIYTIFKMNSALNSPAARRNRVTILVFLIWESFINPCRFTDL